MRYIYMNNFRGFSETLVPIADANFLVGENSTGKSSFLKLLNLFAHPYFSMGPNVVFREVDDLGGFDDIVSAWSKDRTYFDVGMVETRKQGKSRYLYGAIYRFVDNAGMPFLSEHISIEKGRLLQLKFNKGKKTLVRPLVISSEIASESDLSMLLKEVLSSLGGSENKFKVLNDQSFEHMPIPMLLAFADPNREKNEPPQILGSLIDEFRLIWVAPIRTAPKRFYGGVFGNYSPEGAHTPFLLRSTLQSVERSRQFVDKLRAFGEASGLFEGIEAHTFGEDKRAPFELLIKFSGATLNIQNVGYGVSQALPLVVEFLSRSRPASFAIQQPEVHLHPRAQAALGGLIFELVYGLSHTFFIETHSDYLIDRYRLELKRASTKKKRVTSQVIFFSRGQGGNNSDVISIGRDGSYPVEQPPGFRDFFIHEEIQLLDL